MTEDHHAYANSVRRFFEEEYQPQRAKYEEAGVVDLGFWRKAGEMGILGASAPEEYGGQGLSRTFDLVTMLEQARIHDMGFGFSVHNIVMHYVVELATDDQKARWLPRMISGDLVGAIAMTEPGTGSDLQSIRTTAKRDDDHFVLNGSKTFITNGQNADLIVVVARTDPEAGSKGISLLVLETEGAEGFRRGRNLKKLGLKAQDTSELFFGDVRVPVANVLGGHEGRGFVQLMVQLPWERLMLGYIALGMVRTAFAMTVEHVRERKVFGNRVMDFQNTRFKLAEIKTEIEMLGAFLDRLSRELEKGALTAERAAMAKMWATEFQCRAIDTCLQMFGGYGYMEEYPISQLYADARVQRIYGGTSEIMREIVARSIDID
ncbi:MAG: acyl-CoA dehydrogenase family protein [Ectothiorhodospiraceae bacterium]|nr:acyl-CoA dehydrogenase family protein [Ectothiorhodospiraceae bacterium]